MQIPDRIQQQRYGAFFTSHRHIVFTDDKDGISVPGLTLLYLFNNLPEKMYFTLFNEKNKDLHQLLKDSVVGGRALIFHRYHEKGVTKPRQTECGETDQPCRTIVVDDACAPYTWSLMQYLLTVWYITVWYTMVWYTTVWYTRRREENKFLHESSQLYGHIGRGMVDAGGRVGLRFYSSSGQWLGERHRQTSGRRVVPTTRTTYQFHGCFVHS